jgi:hypothetical protein
VRLSKGEVLVAFSRKKENRPAWPALTQRHGGLFSEVVKVITADEAREKGGENTVHASFKGALC